MAAEQTVNGSRATVDVTAPGVTTLTYFATDAAGNDESRQHLDIVVAPASP